MRPPAHPPRVAGGLLSPAAAAMLAACPHQSRRMSPNSIIFLFFLAQVMIALFALFYILRNR